MKFSTSVSGLILFPGLGGQPDWAHDITTEDMVAIAQSADELGYDYLVVPWHIAMKRGGWVENMGPRWPHSLSAAGFLLGATKRIKVVCLVVVPCQQPIELAKALATLDWMSAGRIVPMLMLGYMEWEYDMLGVPFRERGAIMDDYVEAMIELWTAETPTHDGPYVSFGDIAFEPKPVQRPLPLWFGGSARSKKALRRVAKWGSGWMSYASAHAEHPGAIDFIRKQPEFQQRPRGLEVSAYFVEPTHDQYSHEEKEPPKPVVGDRAVMEQIRYLASLGVTVTGAPLTSRKAPGGGPSPIRSVDEHLDRLEWFSTEIMPEARAL